MHSEAAKYEIRVKGHLDARWSSRLEGMTVIQGFDQDGSPITILSGEMIDQSALYGVLATLRDIGIPVLHLHRVELK